MKNWICLSLILVIFSGCQSSRNRALILDNKDSYNWGKPEMIVDAGKRPLRTAKDLIVIDAGHGGEDMGTRSLIPPKYQEKSLNLATALLVKDFLQRMGYLVKMTRSDDTFIPLATRSLIANNYNPKLFLSVHYNAAPSEQAEGIEVYYYQSDDDKSRSVNSKKLADSVLSQVIEKTRAKSRGVKHGNLAVIRETNMPAILIEGGFMTNQSEMEKIKDPAYIKQLAYGIALGVDQYLKK